jgi:hypothetical protein
VERGSRVVIGDPAEHVKIMIAGDSVDGDSVLVEDGQSTLKRAERFERPVLPVNHVTGKEHGIDLRVKSEIDERVPDDGRRDAGGIERKMTGTPGLPGWLATEMEIAGAQESHGGPFRGCNGMAKAAG